ncbi:TIGR03086 family metal-binding protein [Fodinicola feengrottensis]|uniref:TIGR03086 family metal-binding protein n=1 Tax=Fodinicola feengrottensis TaxID=435914 RepID=A0ABN2IUM1_9ACTN|nr:TIGR03086 family metal-binding protein [Fodinicola feengrottensis]
MSDPRILFGQALDQAEKVIAEATEEKMSLPTPCEEFDVRKLSGHMIGVVRRVIHTGKGGKAADVSSLVPDLPAAELIPLFHEARATVEQVWSDDALLDKVLSLPFGEFPGRAAMLAYAQEMTVHSWDLAKALGRLDLLDDSLAEAVLPIARQFVPADARGGPIPFGPVVEVEPDAGPYAQLAGHLGRRP